MSVDGYRWWGSMCDNCWQANLHSIWQSMWKSVRLFSLAMVLRWNKTPRDVISRPCGNCCIKMYKNLKPWDGEEDCLNRCTITDVNIVGLSRSSCDTIMWLDYIHSFVFCSHISVLSVSLRYILYFSPCLVSLRPRGYGPRVIQQHVIRKKPHGSHGKKNWKYYPRIECYGKECPAMSGIILSDLVNEACREWAEILSNITCSYYHTIPFKGIKRICINTCYEIFVYLYKLQIRVLLQYKDGKDFERHWNNFYSFKLAGKGFYRRKGM